MQEVVNLTPHAISVMTEEGIRTFEPSGVVARVQTTTETLESVSGVPVSRTQFGEVSGLPAPKSGVVYIASSLVASHAKRPDVLSPDTGPTAIRKDGQIVAVRAFQSF